MTLRIVDVVEDLSDDALAQVYRDLKAYRDRRGFIVESDWPPRLRHFAHEVVDEIARRERQQRLF